MLSSFLNAFLSLIDKLIGLLLSYRLGQEDVILKQLEMEQESIQSKQKLKDKIESLSEDELDTYLTTGILADRLNDK